MRPPCLPRLSAVVAAFALMCLAVPAGAPAAAQEPPRVFALGGPAALPDDALRRAEETLGAAAVRLAGPERFSTAVAISRHAHPGGAATLYLVGADGVADALAASTAVVARQAALLPVRRDDVPDPVLAEIDRLAPDRVYVVGGPSAVSEPVRQRLAERLGRPVRRLAGADRYATAALLTRHANRDGAATVYVANGHAAADALAVSSALAAHGGSLLLTAPDALPAVTAEELARLAPADVRVVGGTAAVSDAVVDQIAAATGVTPLRVSGPDRVATAAAVAHHARPDGATTVYLAAARGHADALTAAAAVSAHDGVLLLVEPVQPVWWVPRLDEAIRYARARSGSVSFAAIGTDGVLAGHRAATRVPAASVLKVMFMVAWLRQPSVAARELTDSDRALLEPMIRRSANEPATHIANRLGPGPMDQLAADAGMADFSYTRPWGNSRTSARDQARFLLEVDRFVPERHRAYALRLLTEVVAEQRWGIGQVPTPGWTAHFKGGWGSGTGATDHQVVLLRHTDGTRAALAVMTTSSPSHAYGKDTLHGVFQRLLADLPRGVA